MNNNYCIKPTQPGAEGWVGPAYGLHRLINSGAMNYLNPNDVRKYIQENGCDVDLPDEEGSTPLHQAAQFGLFEIAKILVLEFGANINAQATNGWTPLIEACFIDSIYFVRDKTVETVKFLVEQGANQSIKCSEGKTALDYAEKTYFDRTIYYYLLRKEIDWSRYNMITTDFLGKTISVRLKGNIKYSIRNYKLDEPVAGEVIVGKLSAVCQDVEFFDEYPAMQYDVRPDNAIVRIYALNKDGVRTWDFYQFHHDDVEVELVSDECCSHGYERLCGRHVDVQAKSSSPIYYQLDGMRQVLGPRECVSGKLWQMTGRLGEYSYEMAHIEVAGGGRAVFFADEILIG